MAEDAGRALHEAHGEEGVIVQEKSMSFFRQKNHIPLTALSIVACFVLSPLLGGFLALPQVLTMVPVALLLLLAYVGPVSAVVCSAIVISIVFSFFGTWAAVCMALLLVPTAVVSVIVCQRGQPFFTASAAGCVALFASMGAALGLLSVLAGSDVVTALSNAMREMFADYQAMSDFLLTMLIQMGALAAPEGFDMAAGMASVDAATRAEMLSSVVLMMDAVLRLEIPAQLATGSIAAGLFGQALLRKGAIARGMKTDYPPVYTWRVPRGWGLILGGTLAVLFVFSRMLPAQGASIFYVFSGVFDMVFALQGIASVSYLLHERGKAGFWHGLVFVLGYTLLRSAAVMAGIFDQMVDFTHRRRKLDGEDEPEDSKKNLV